MFVRRLLSSRQSFGREEGGQVAIMMVLMLIGVFAIVTLALDFGLWFADHRSAQNQVDAAAAAAGQALPCSDAAACQSVLAASCSGASPTSAAGLASFWLKCNGES